MKNGEWQDSTMICEANYQVIAKLRMLEERINITSVTFKEMSISAIEMYRSGTYDRKFNAMRVKLVKENRRV